MTSTRPKRHVRNITPAPPVEDDATIVRTTLDRIIYTVDVLARFDRTRRDIAAVHRGETNKTMAQVMSEARWHEHATKSKKECPLGSTKKKRYYTIEEETDSDGEEDDPNVPSTSAKKAPKPVPEKKVPTPSKAKLAAMKKKEDAARRKAEREAKKLEALNEQDEDEREESEERSATVSSSKTSTDLPTSSSTPNAATPENRVIPEIKIDEYVSQEPKVEEEAQVPEEPKLETAVSNYPVVPGENITGPEEKPAPEEPVAPEDEKMEVDEPMEEQAPPTLVEKSLGPEEMELDAPTIDAEESTPSQIAEENQPALEAPESPKPEENEPDQAPPVLEKMVSPEPIQDEEMGDANSPADLIAEEVIPQETLLEEENGRGQEYEESVVQEEVPETFNLTSEVPTSQTSEEPMQQGSEIPPTEITEASTNQASESIPNEEPFPPIEKFEPQEIQEAEIVHSEMQPTESTEEPAGPPEAQANETPEEPMVENGKPEEPLTEPQFSPTHDAQPAESEKPEPIPSTSQNLDDIEFPTSEPLTEDPQYRPWIEPGSTTDIVDYENPDDATITPEDLALKPWLGNDVPLYPLNLLPPIDKVPGRVWYPPRKYCESTKEMVVAIGPLTELETLNMALTPEALRLVEPDKYDLIMKRICEIQIAHLRKRLEDSNLPAMTRVELTKKLEEAETTCEKVTMRAMKFRFRFACLPDLREMELPKKPGNRKYAVFDHTWYTTNRKWSEKSRRVTRQVTRKDFMAHFQVTTDSAILEFQKEMLENAKKLEDAAAEEKIKTFRLPLMYKLSKFKPEVKEQMVIFRKKMALYFQYDDFEKCYLTDPGCREIIKKLRPLPFDNGATIDEAEKELTALMVSYMHRFARENPVLPLHKAGNEKLPTPRDIEKNVKRCVEDMVDTLVFREQTDLPTFWHRVPAHNNSIPKFPAQYRHPINEGLPIELE